MSNKITPTVFYRTLRFVVKICGQTGPVLLAKFERSGRESPYLHPPRTCELIWVVTISATNNPDVYFQFTYPASSSFCVTLWTQDATGDTVNSDGDPGLQPPAQKVAAQAHRSTPGDEHPICLGSNQNPGSFKA
jgi:hypothetical protein